jgi:hypothetical protein
MVVRSSGTLNGDEIFNNRLSVEDTLGFLIVNDKVKYENHQDATGTKFHMGLLPDSDMILMMLKYCIIIKKNIFHN